MSICFWEVYDEMMCDMGPMHAGYILMEKTWLYVRRVIHDGLRIGTTFLGMEKC